MPTLFIDLSATAHTNLKTGIERVATALYLECASLNISGLQVEPIYLTLEEGQWQYRYACRFAAQLSNSDPNISLMEDLVQIGSGDVLLLVDLGGERFVEASQQGLYLQLQARGVQTHAIVYDLLPLQFPLFFPPGSAERHRSWLDAAIDLGSLICISQSVACDVQNYIDHQRHQETASLKSSCQINYIQLGANFKRINPDAIIPEHMKSLLEDISTRPSFLSVGTIEPRKGYEQTLAAFTILWQEGLDVNLILVGAEGWAYLPATMRRTIPELVCQLRAHPEFGRRLFWFEGVNDAVLDQLYRSSICLIAASEGEGFGLPLIEAAQYGLPILARGIPVFKEALGQYGQYFYGTDAKGLSQAVWDWYRQHEQQKHSLSSGFEWSDWRRSSLQLLTHLQIVSANLQEEK